MLSAAMHGTPQKGQQAVGADEEMNSFLSTERGMSWLADQLAEWPGDSSVTDFTASIRARYVKDMKPQVRIMPLPTPVPFFCLKLDLRCVPVCIFFNCIIFA